MRPGDRLPGHRPIDHLPAGHHTGHYYGHDYYHHDHNWWQPYWYGGYARYWPVYPPVGYYYGSLPANSVTIEIGGGAYYLSEGVYYTEGEKDGEEGYVVAEPPEQSTTQPTVTSEDPSAPNPFDILRKMSDYLGRQKQLGLLMSDSSDEVRESGEKIRLSSRRTVYVSRPDKMSVEFRGDHENRRVVYDGKTVTMLDRKRDMHASVAAPDTIGKTLDTMAKDYGIWVPLGDMLYEDAYSTITPGVQTGQYVGRHTVGVYLTHHLAFTQDTIDWEIWIQIGERPLPRKLVIVYKNQPEHPRYTATITNWEIPPTFPPNVFEMKIPADSKKIEVAPMTPTEGSEGTTPPT